MACLMKTKQLRMCTYQIQSQISNMRHFGVVLILRVLEFLIMLEILKIIVSTDVVISHLLCCLISWWISGIMRFKGVEVSRLLLWEPIY